MYKDEEQKLNLMYNQLNNTRAYYPKDTTIIQLFMQQVQRTPDALAAICGEHCLTYKELDRKSNQIAVLLRQHGCTKQSIVGILVERSLDMLIGIYGIMKSGAAYLPIQPTLPLKRFEYIISNSNVHCLCTQTKFLHKFAGINVKYIDLNDPSIDTLPEDSPSDLAGPGDLMYVMYTSGSTGTPKGVMIEHRSVVNRIHWMQKTYPLTSTDRYLQKTPFVFDVSVWELFWWAVCGAAVCLLGPELERFPLALLEEIKRNYVTVLHFVPSMFNVFCNFIENCACLQSLHTTKYIFSSGEALLPSHVRKFYRILAKDYPIRFINLYGPTEATIDVTFYDCLGNHDPQIVPIGKPIDNITLYILDGKALQPPGVPGELCIGGVGVARGYVNDETLTHVKFIR